MTHRGNEPIGSIIRRERELAGMSQADLGAYLDPPRSYAAISDIERGKSRLKVDDLISIARALGLHPAAFLKESSQ